LKTPPHLFILRCFISKMQSSMTPQLNWMLQNKRRRYRCGDDHDWSKQMMLN